MHIEIYEDCADYVESSHPQSNLGGWSRPNSHPKQRADKYPFAAHFGTLASATIGALTASTGPIIAPPRALTPCRLYAVDSIVQLTCGLAT